MDTDVLIIGGGISGLATAWWLAQAGVQVEIWEKSMRPGGKIKSTRQDGYLTERAASMIMNFKPEVDELLEISGLNGEKQKRQLDSESRRYLLHQGQLKPLPMTIGGMLLTPLWSNRARLRLLAEAFIPRRTDSNETVASFIKRRLGAEFLDKAMDPFIAGTLASDPSQANAMSVLPRLKALENQYGSITAGVMVNKILRRRTARTTEIFSFDGGINTMVKKLVDCDGVKFRGCMDVTQIRACKQGWQVSANSLNGETSKTCRQIIVTTPAAASARLLRRTSTEISNILDSIEYAPLSVVHLGFDRQQVPHRLDSTGFLVPGQEKRNITGNLWMSSLFSNRAPQSKVLLTSYLGGARQARLSQLSDDRSIDCVLADLQSILNIRGLPEMARIDRHQQALPLYHGNYQQRMQNLDSELCKHKGLNLVANYRGGVSVRDRIACARQMANSIIHELQHSDNTAISLPPVLPAHITATGPACLKQ
ncbi:MAG: protoporphyrinogen oxidase [Gammaproteobacteria bacterium]|nr:protoporphyrinogen oxidase [Gammaproteobacteria bacterium]